METVYLLIITTRITGLLATLSGPQIGQNKVDLCCLGQALLVRNALGHIVGPSGLDVKCPHAEGAFQMF
jgi:hypothetical protein